MSIQKATDRTFVISNFIVDVWFYSTMFTFGVLALTGAIKTTSFFDCMVLGLKITASWMFLMLGKVAIDWLMKKFIDPFFEK